MQGKQNFSIFKIISKLKKSLFLITSVLLLSCGGGSVPATPAPPTNIIATASYANTTCAIKAINEDLKGSLTCWGQIPDKVDLASGIAARNFRVQELRYRCRLMRGGPMLL